MKRKIFWFISVILFLPLAVKADSVSLKCPSEFEPNQEFSCEMYGDSSLGTYTVESNITLVNLTYVTFNSESGLQGNAFYNDNTGSYKVGLYGANLLKNSFKIGTIRLKGTGNYSSGKVMVSGTVYSGDTGGKISAGGAEKTISLKQTQPSGGGSAGGGTTGGSSGSGGTTGGGTSGGTTGGGSTNKGSTSGGSSNSGTTNKNGSTNKTDTTKDTKTEEDVEKTGEDETVEEYNIDFSKGAYLIDLKIDGYDIDFRSDIFQYKIKIGSEKKLKISPVVSSKDVTYTIIDNDNLKDGSIVTIEVIYKNKDIKNYYITVEKNENKRTLTFILIGIIAVLVLINIVRLLIRRDNNETED